MWDIHTEKKKRKTFGIKNLKTNGFRISKPLIGILIINLIVLIATLVFPNLISLLWLSGTEQSIIRAYTFNFVHGGIFHFLMNMLVLVAFDEHVRRTNRYKKWPMYVIYYVFPLIIGIIAMPLISNPTVGYSGVVIGMLVYGILNKMPRYKALAIELVIIHAIIIALGAFSNISVLVHGIGALVGAGLYFLMRMDTTILHAGSYKRKKAKRSNRSWRERHSKL